MHRLTALAAVAALVLTAGACATPSKEKSSLDGTAGSTARSGSGQAASEEAKPKQPWWRLSQYSRKPGFITEKERQERRPGLLSGKDGEFVLYREGEAGRSSDPSKPTKLKR